jgi:hypothetical protein
MARKHRAVFVNGIGKLVELATRYSEELSKNACQKQSMSHNVTFRTNLSVDLSYVACSFSEVPDWSAHDATTGTCKDEAKASSSNTSCARKTYTKSAQAVSVRTWVVAPDEKGSLGHIITLCGTVG